jgi:hypothetical protein
MAPFAGRAESALCIRSNGSFLEVFGPTGSGSVSVIGGGYAAGLADRNRCGNVGREGMEWNGGRSRRIRGKELADRGNEEYYPPSTRLFARRLFGLQARPAKSNASCASACLEIARAGASPSMTGMT